jgi:dihydrofolate reductase
VRKIIAALQTSLDGLIEGPNGELDWVESWEDPFDLLSQVDAFILGRGMYAGYEQYWGAVLADPDGILPSWAGAPRQARSRTRSSPGRRHTLCSRGH